MKRHHLLWLTGLLASFVSATDIKQALLEAHNEVRAEVGAVPLVWSARAETQAAGWAHELSKRCDIEHSRGSGFGENLFMGTLGYYDELDGVKSWEEEKRYYSGQPLTRALVLKVGHYTQMVWSDTQELGCATSTCNDIMILVCNYHPPGNYLGEAAW
ncbi:CAP domain-containing protein [Oceanimonas sp. CHS3-5]|uniref:CAP domain-containing protein n=1 Tax=Oceanimonas sp. CHS3-5 TaxID=3068186 RepID=UPI00273DDCDA|nr:CAP domain-containing protein [Oceanimonas sp. CHS3-5]MDP5293098.1 CAP domain-containing protein [Oceanimonas sp. CHS3-5]